MRKLKFKAWNIKCKFWVSPKEIERLLNQTSHKIVYGYNYNNIENDLACDSVDLSGKPNYELEEVTIRDIFNEEKHTIVQYTDFTDADGEEIFEGDIIYFLFDCRSKPDNCVIEYRPEFYSGYIIHTKMGLTESLAEATNYSNKTKIRGKKVGDMFANPELIE